ncbi:MAG: UDP-N-acetylmuramoyl-tripeptide--D-alanyl-D-alanine ligase, partial [Lachnospiraceae bacterium]|nr:UDP-N-acetylmuramoyl-tripeptide--D-alanyl-D-alanine ligase [Lachnospiraceae bacterium]
IRELCDIVHPRHGVITSIGPQHLETFFNMENIQNTKFELADALPQDGMLFLNGDNPYIQEKAASYGNRIFYYNESSGEGYDTRDVSVSPQGTEFTVISPDGETEHFQTHLIGAHNIINVVGAIAVAHSLGIALKDLKIPVRRLKPAEHRLQLRRQGAVTIIDDAYNSNPIGSKAAVETLAMFDGVRIMITPGMVELGEKEADYNYQFGQYAAPCCDYVLLVGEKHTKPIYEGLMAEGFCEQKCQVFERLEDALTFAYGIKDQRHKYILLENDLPDNY